MRMLGWISRLLLTVLLASTVSMLSTWTVMQMYVERVLESFQLPGDQLDVKFTDFLAQAVRQLPGETGSAGNSGLREEVDRILEVNDPMAFEEEEEEKPVQGGAETGSGDQNGEEPPMPDAVAVWGRSIGEEEQAQDQLFISMEEFSAKREMLTDDDKWTIFSLIMTKLPKEELQMISTIMENGLTESEMIELLSILESYLDASEMEQLLEIVNKY
ncbi:hypothetical protein DUZ99_09765 [Xylanibacillus composti]|uniref:Uncharacterized protein n=1 Tax=Xylanibacillus composti TaxID=1572762 RepID=A0A8J4H899_9BACL|nr:hypothetical protein [Xylanibacillus composti]MDT9725258.1 hypothetical protein [Xylanibacillus composti]GIQ70458.1 hypothetical protein XYCOK13_32820 [Xylanibacillus composti]